MAAAIDAKQAEELKKFEACVQAILQNDNAIRTQGETALGRVRDTSIDKYYLLLVQSLAHSKQLPNVRQFAAVVLRQNLAKTAKAWDAAAKTTHATVKGVLLELFKTETERVIRRKVSDCIGTLAGKILKDGGWPELMPTLSEVAKSPHALHRESVLEILDKLAEWAIDVLRPAAATLKAIFNAGLDDEKNPPVRLAALRAVCSMVMSLEVEKERAVFSECIPKMFKGMQDAFIKLDDDMLKDSGEVLVNLARNQPTFLRPALKSVVTAMVAVVAQKKLEDDTRRISLEFLLTLMERGKGMVRKLPEFPKLLIPLAMQLLLEVPEDHTAWEQDLEAKDEDADEYQNYQMGLEAIDRMAMSLGPKLFMTNAFPIIQNSLNQKNPLVVAAGLMCIGEMAEGCNKLLKPHLPKVVDMILPLTVASQHSRVRWAAMNCLAQLATDFGTKFCQQYHAKLMPIYLAGLDLKLPIRLVRHAMMGIIDFAAWAETEHIVPYLDGAMPALVAVLKQKSVKMQEAALQTISSVALLAENHFIKFYDAMMPGIKGLFINARGREQRELRAKCMECIGIIGKAVGRDKFVKDGKEVMELLVKQNAAGYEADDPQAISFVQTASRICQAIEDDFLPYLPTVIPPLLKSAQLENAIIIHEEGEQNPVQDEDGYKTIPYEVRNHGIRYVSVNGAILEEKTTATHVLFQYVQQLKDGFFPYVDAVAKVMVPMVRFQFHEAVRINCIAAMPCLVLSVHMYYKKLGQFDAGRAAVHKLWEFMFQPFVEAIQYEPNMQSLEGILDALSDTIAIIDTPLPPAQVDILDSLCSELVKLSEERRQKREAKRQKEDFDEEESAVIDEENEQEDEFLSFVFLINSKLARCCKESYVPSFHKHMFPHWGPMLDAKKSTGQRTAAMCAIDDVIQFCGKPALIYVKDFYPVVLQAVNHTDVDIRQSAVFGVGACAQAAGAPFIPAIPSALAALHAVVEKKGSRDDENEPATDNAISSIGKIMLNFPQVLMPLPAGSPTKDGAAGAAPVADAKSRPEIKPEFQLAQLLPTWLNWLPCVGDEEEAGVVHNQMCLFLEKPAFMPMLMGAGNVNLPKVIKIVADVIDSTLIQEDTQRRLLAIVNKIFATVPPPAKAKLWSLLTEHQRKRLAKYIAVSAATAGTAAPATAASPTK